MDYKEAARDFIENEKQFHLGVIPTEQSNPRTRNLSATIAKDTAAGIKMILSADTDIPAVTATAFETPEFKRMVDDMKRVIDEKKTLLFSSVGASGRMALQMDATWRYFWTSLIQKLPAKKQMFMENSERSNSFMTGGDRALVKTAENYEDYMTFGAEQIKEAKVGPGDVVIGLSECGLSASINGSVIEADNQGCTTYYIYCNPREILVKYLDRVRVVFERENIIKISLYVGNMAVSGSTRMQVTTVELLAVGAAIEVACWRWLKENLTAEELSVLGQGAFELGEYSKMYQQLLDTLGQGESLKGLTKAVEYETATYQANGLVTYVTHEYLQDIMTDTTERQPTFTLPPFRKFADHTSQISWAYVKDPLYPNSVTWQHVFRRPIKGLDWSKADYIRMKASQAIIDNPPALGSNEIEQYCIGNEADTSRYSRQPAKLVAIDINGSANCQMMKWFNEEVKHYDGGLVIRMGNIPDHKLNDNEIWIPVKLPRTITDLMTHLLVKLAFNLLSTATMAKMGRVWSNWMIQVFPSNKKLIDRSTRIISTLAKIPYEQACEEFFKSYLGRKPGEEYRESFVVETLRRLGFDPNAEIK